MSTAALTVRTPEGTFPAVDCPDCNGTGVEPGTTTNEQVGYDCTRCEGDGVVACGRCRVSRGYHVDLHGGHDWTNVCCPAYRTLQASDCTCK